MARPFQELRDKLDAELDARPDGDAIRERAALDLNVSVVREVLIEAVDEIPYGSEGYVGWSDVLAQKIVAALNRERQ